MIRKMMAERTSTTMNIFEMPHGQWLKAPLIILSSLRPPRLRETVRTFPYQRPVQPSPWESLLMNVSLAKPRTMAHPSRTSFPLNQPPRDLLYAGISPQYYILPRHVLLWRSSCGWQVF